MIKQSCFILPIPCAKVNVSGNFVNIYQKVTGNVVVFPIDTY